MKDYKEVLFQEVGVEQHPLSNGSSLDPYFTEVVHQESVARQSTNIDANLTIVQDLVGVAVGTNCDRIDTKIYDTFTNQICYCT